MMCESLHTLTKWSFLTITIGIVIYKNFISLHQVIIVVVDLTNIYIQILLFLIHYIAINRLCASSC